MYSASELGWMDEQDCLFQPDVEIRVEGRTIRHIVSAKIEDICCAMCINRQLRVSIENGRTNVPQPAF